MLSLLRKLAVVGTALLIVGLSRAGSLLQHHHDAQINHATPLFAGEPVRGQISAGDSKIYSLNLTSGQYVRLRLDPVGVYLRLTLYSPLDRVLADVTCRRDGPTPVSLVAEASGTYRVRLSALEKERKSGRYELRVEDLRAARPSDAHLIGAERISAEGERLRIVGTGTSTRKAIVKYSDAVSRWSATKEKDEESYGLKTIGTLLLAIGEPHKALSYFNRAARAAREAKSPRLEADATAGMAQALTQLGQYEKAQAFCETALALSGDIDDRSGKARALNNLGRLQYLKGERQKALERYEQSLELWRDLRDRQGLAQALLNSAYVYSDKHESARALDLFGEAVSLFREMDDNRGQAMTLTAIGHLYSRSGKKQEALDTYYKARHLALLAGDPIEAGRILNGMGNVYEDLGALDTALGFYEQALLSFKTASYRRGELSSLISIGDIHNLMGAFVKARVVLNSALRTSRVLRDQMLESYTLKSLAYVYKSLGHRMKALAYYREALDLYGRLGERQGEAQVLAGLGHIYYSRGETERALSYQQQALALNRSVMNQFGEASALCSIALIERDLGRLIEARAHADEAVNVIESIRTVVKSPELRGSYVAIARQSYELSVDLLMQYHSGQPSSGLDAAALHTCERGRARTLIEMLAEARAGIRHGVDASVLEQERVLEQSLSDKAKAQNRLLSRRHTDEQAAAVAKEIEVIRTEYQQVQAMIRSTSPRYAALTQPQPLTLKEIQEQVLDPETLLLEYALGDERSYLWAVTPDSLTSFELPKRADIETAARRVYALLTAQNQIITGETALQRQQRLRRAEDDYAKAAASLSEMLLGQVASQLGTKRLVIVADGALQYIPFGALPAPGRRIAPQAQASAKKVIGQPLRTSLQPPTPAPQPPILNPQPLIVDHEIISLPSASTLAVMRRELANRKPAPKAVAVLADPVFSSSDPRVNSNRSAASREPLAVSISRDFERAIKEVRVSRKRGGVARLPFSRAEADAINLAAPAGQALQAVDFDASRATAMSADLSQYRIVHFATHGLLNSEHPELSGMVFSLVDRQGKQQNGFLRLHEVYNLNLPAELVVLSACQTGLGKDVKGEGLVGLTRGFMYAGAARVVASLWQVDDSATADLMQLFYTKMLRDGLRPAAALRDAQVEMWKKKQWKMPYYWAAFTLQGEWK